MLLARVGSGRWRRRRGWGAAAPTLAAQHPPALAPNKQRARLRARLNFLLSQLKGDHCPVACTLAVHEVPPLPVYPRTGGWHAALPGSRFAMAQSGDASGRLSRWQRPARAGPQMGRQLRGVAVASWLSAGGGGGGEGLSEGSPTQAPPLSAPLPKLYSTKPTAPATLCLGSTASVTALQ